MKINCSKKKTIGIEIGQLRNLLAQVLDSRILGNRRRSQIFLARRSVLAASWKLERWVGVSVDAGADRGVGGRRAVRAGVSYRGLVIDEEGFVAHRIAEVRNGGHARPEKLKVGRIAFSVTYESSGIKTTVVTGYLARLAVSKHGFVILAVHLTFVIQLFEVP